MKNLSENNSFNTNKTKIVPLKLVYSAEDTELIQRKARAQKIVSDSKLYISSKIFTEELKEHVDALKAQDDKLTTLETIVMLLDYAEREFDAIKILETPKKGLLGTLKKFFNIFK